MKHIIMQPFQSCNSHIQTNCKSVRVYSVKKCECVSQLMPTVAFQFLNESKNGQHFMQESICMHMHFHRYINFYFLFSSVVLSLA